MKYKPENELKQSGEYQNSNIRWLETTASPTMEDFKQQRSPARDAVNGVHS